MMNENLQLSNQLLNEFIREVKASGMLWGRPLLVEASFTSYGLPAKIARVKSSPARNGSHVVEDIRSGLPASG